VPLSSPIDILGLGAVAVDDLLYVDRYPPPDTKARVLRRERQGGGLTATALVAAARLGARCAYAGTLGDDDLSNDAAGRLRSEGIDLTHLRREPDARPVHSAIVIDTSRQTRNIFFDLNGVVGASPDWPPAEVIQSSRVLFVDYLGLPGMLRAARLARAAGRSVVGDLESEAAPLVSLVDHLILSWEIAWFLTRAATPAEAAQALWHDDRQVVAVTHGAQGCWYVAAGQPGPPRHQPAFPVAVVDTTGCGDVFHGAYAAALARDLPVTERFRWAAAAAALKATRPGGQAGAPTHSELTRFLEENPS
jgi:sugar/nucleoside kinase (ribokinase family)